MTRTLPLLAALAVAVPGSARAQQFGSAVSVTEDEIIIAEPVVQDGPAVLHLYRRAGDDWVPDGTLGAPDAGTASDYFGRFVARDGETLFVGGTTFEQSTGNVWQFRRRGGSWEFVGSLRPDDVEVGDSYGRVGLLSGDLLFVTALGHGEQRGAVWVFRRGSGGAWTRETRLDPGEGSEQGEFFGWSLAFDGERLLAGALTIGPRQNRGAAYVMRRTAPGQWVQEARLAPGDEATPGYGFGSAVAWIGGRAVVSAPGADGGAGTAFVYEQDPVTGAWERNVALAAFDRQPGAGFGSSMDVAGGSLWVGAPGADDAGRVYRFEIDPAAGAVRSVEKLAGLDQDVGDGFGSVVSTGDRVAVVGQLGDDFGLGSAVVMQLGPAGWRAADKLLGPDPEGLDPLVGSDIRCSDGSADQFDCESVDILSFLPVAGIGGGRGAETNDVWGWTDPESGREIAIVGRTDGTAFVDVSNPNRPVYLGNLAKTPGSRGNAWRDMKVYADHVFIVADGAGDHGMQVFDLRRLRDVSSPPVEFEPDALYERIASAHNIVVNEETGFAYAVGSNSGGETCGGGLHMIDVRNPTSPTFVGCFADARTGNSGTGYSHDGMCIVYDGPDEEHRGKEICFGSNESALSVADVSDKANPVPISFADYPNVGYAHQGWITEDHRYFFMNDEGDESNSVQAGQPMPGTRTLVWDIQDLDDPIVVKEHYGTTFTIDHNLYIKGDLMYQSNYVSGLRILDVSDPVNPREVGFLDTVPWSEEVVFDGSWSNYPYFASGTVVVTSGKEGVFFVRYSPPVTIP